MHVAKDFPSQAKGSTHRRWLKRFLLSVGLCVVVLVGILGGAWWWSGQADSLHQTLTRVARWLPDDQKLEAQGVQGTLRNGGHIDWLRWSSPSMQVEVQNADIDWSLRALFSRALHFARVDMQQLRIHSTPSGAEKEEPLAPLQSLQLPVTVDLPVRIQQLVWEGTPRIEITDLDARYRYTGQLHELEVQSLRYAEGAYTAQAQLQATAPMQIQASVQGDVHAALPQQEDKTLHLIATANVQGTLATEAARLHLNAKAHVPESNSEITDHSSAMSADVAVVILPWQPKILEQADAQLNHVNAAWFLADGPQTDLSGRVQAGPQEQGWQFQALLTNLLPGPWDQQALPVRALSAKAQFDGQAEWVLESARIDFGSRGDSHVEAQGRFDTGDQVFEGQLNLKAINPSEIYSTLDAASVSGALQARSTADQKVQFQLNIQAAAPRTPQALHVNAARVDGIWLAPQLQLNNVFVDALDVTLQSKSLAFNTETQRIQGALTAKFPGTDAELSLQAGPEDGTGQLRVELQKPQALLAWLARLPGVELPEMRVQGSADAQLRWQGGWHKLQQRLLNPTAQVEASGLKLNAVVRAPTLSYEDIEGFKVQISQFLFSAVGSPEALRLDLNADARVGEHAVSLDTDITAGLQSGPQAHALDWRIQVSKLLAQWKTAADTELWKAVLAEPLTIQQSTTGSPVQSSQIKATAGRITVTPPSMETSHAASVVWDPVSIQRRESGAWSIRSKGRLQGLPLMWVDTLNPHNPPLAGLGISGDLVLQGEWDVDNTGRSMRAQALIERASGDIRFSAEDDGAANVTIIRSTGASARNATTNQVQASGTSRGRGVRARIQEMRVQVNAQGNDVRAQLDWATERAGKIQANLSSQVRYTPSGIVWPDNAPISGSIDAELPNIGVWAFFAPPGWRAAGSFHADLDLTGTRKSPDWRGTIQADQMSLQSQLDGVDLKDGRLRALFRGSRLDITEIYFQGGEGSRARIVGQSGNLTVAPQSGGTLKGFGFIEYDPKAQEGTTGLSMSLKAVADQLQVLVRADRQLSVSGSLEAALNQGQFKLDGDLKVDRAAITLADDSAPTLGADVYITSAATRAAAQDKAAKEAAATVKSNKPPILNVKINLGDDFALQGYGITTRLGGALTVTQGPRITGEIHTIQGRYRAWGQLLDVEKGTIRFNGPYANPAIDIIAIRPNIDVRAGIKVTGSVNNPRVTLFSEPDMSDAEKLSWIIMGRGASGGGAEAALLQQAALALLSGGGNSGNFASQLGFDEIGFRGPSDDGEQDAALTIGKRLSKDLYLTYEQSLSGAMGTLYIFYDLSRRLTLRAQTGENSAIDLIYTKVSD